MNQKTKKLAIAEAALYYGATLYGIISFILIMVIPDSNSSKMINDEVFDMPLMLVACLFFILALAMIVSIVRGVVSKNDLITSKLNSKKLMIATVALSAAGFVFAIIVGTILICMIYIPESDWYYGVPIISGALLLAITIFNAVISTIILVVGRKNKNRV